MSPQPAALPAKPPAPRPMHPVILAVRKRDKELRDAGKPWGLWSIEEVADVLQTGRSNVYEAANRGAIEASHFFGHRGANRSQKRRITSNGIIAFVQANTSGPDESLTLGNLFAVIRTLSLEALRELEDYTQGRMKIVSNGGPLLPRPRRSLSAALEVRAEDAHPDLFAEAVPGSGFPVPGPQAAAVAAPAAA